MACLGIENTGARLAGRAGEGGEGDGISFYVQCDYMNPWSDLPVKAGSTQKVSWHFAFPVDRSGPSESLFCKGAVYVETVFPQPALPL